MANIKIKTTLIIFLISFQFSCKNWMELLPPEGLIRDEFWKTKEDVQSVLMGTYDALAQMDALMFKYGEIRADLVKGDYSLWGDEPKMMEGNIYPDNSLCNWKQFYQVINYCNEVIKNAPLVKEKDYTFTEYQLQGFLSEAYFIRSLCYFYLVRIFKDVPLVLDPSETDNTNFYLPKTDGEAILDKISNDLKAIRSYATVDGYLTLAENKGRATKAAIDALLADISLWNFDYESCIQYIENIVSSQKYKLMPSSRWFEMFYPGNSMESIFEVQYSNNLNQKNRLYDITQVNAHLYDPSQKAIEIFGKKYIRELVRGEGISIRKNSEADFTIWKYVGRLPDGSTTRSGSDLNSAHWIVYRYADVLLMKAEALSQLGRYDEALDIINTIRERADVPLLSIPYSATAFEDRILEERASELAFEGKRWFDLLRMGRRNNYSRKSKLIDIIVSNVPATQKRILTIKLTNPLGWYLPIYKQELERNKYLVQNPYYTNL